VTTLSHPAAVQARLQEIDTDLALHQNEYEDAASAHFTARRIKEKARAEAFLKAEGTVAERSAKADLETALIGIEEEGRWEGLRGVVKVLDTRAAIGMSLLRAQGRGA
jgi:hypothetical protein